jgi:prepilin-type N-terminal cleavage/methylation domain-containing protein
MTMFRTKRGQNRGFTMIELMVVVVIVGILAGVAIPMYGKYIKNARLSEGTGRMGEIITACKSYAMENQSITGTPTWPPANPAGTIVDLSASQSFTYAITAGAGANANTTALTITATGIPGQRLAGVTVAITVANINANGGAPVVTGL